MVLPKIKSIRPTKDGFGQGVLDAAKVKNSVFCIGTDITASVGLDLFKNSFPERFFSLGIAEQNAVGVAAGMALEGKIPVFSSYAVFSALRTTDQIRVSVCYNNLHVIIGGAHAGVSVGPDGATHQALEDIAIMRVLPNMTVLSPCDATQTQIAVMHAITNFKGPVYIRYGRAAVPDFSEDNQDFQIGRSQELVSGDDLTIMATGHMVWEALKVAQSFKDRGISVSVLNFHTIKPLDVEAIVSAAKKTKAIVTAEEHQKIGGFGSAVAEVLSQYYPVPLEMVGMDDCFGESGEPYELLEKFKLNATAIEKAALKAIARKQ